MCGIAGIFNKYKHIDPERASLMVDMLQPRGPDDSGSVFVNHRRGFLGHTRLAIQDLTANGHQPMQSPSGRYWLVLNGEIYNAPNLKSQYLKDRSLHGHSDTEIFLNLIDVLGFEKSLSQLIGMFAIACWDAQLNRLYLARDRMGEKPLYYGVLNDDLIFSSEIKAIHAYTKGELNLNTEALLNYLRFSYVPKSDTIFKGIHKLLPGHYGYLDIDSDCGVTVKPYHSQSVMPSFELGNASHQLEVLLSEVIVQQQLSDRPIGAFLSGGIDSSLVVALLQKHSSRPIQTFTIGFTEQDYDESKYAELVASHLGCQHTTQMLSAEDVADCVPHLSYVYDEPFADSSQLPTLLLSHLAKSAVSVVLTGDGADELFGGYNRYTWARRLNTWLSTLPYKLRQPIAGLLKLMPHTIVRRIAACLPSRYALAHPVNQWCKFIDLLQIKHMAELYQYLVSTHHAPNQLVHFESRYAEAPCFASYFDHSSSMTETMMHLDQHTYLPDDILVKVDRAAMSVGLETRAPYLDLRVVDFARQWASGVKLEQLAPKSILREILGHHLPENFFQRPKMGFGIPLEAWLKGRLKTMVDDVLNQGAAPIYRYIKRPQVLRLWRGFLSGKHRNASQIWNLFMLVMWSDRWLSISNTNQNVNIERREASCL